MFKQTRVKAGRLHFQSQTITRELDGNRKSSRASCVIRRTYIDNGPTKFPRDVIVHYAHQVHNQLSVLPSARSDTLRARVGKGKSVVERVTRRSRRALLSITWNATRSPSRAVSVPLARLRAYSVRVHAFLSNSRVTLTRFLCPSQLTRRYAPIAARSSWRLFACTFRSREAEKIEQLKKKKKEKIHSPTKI